MNGRKRRLWHDHGAALLSGEDGKNGTKGNGRQLQRRTKTRNATEHSTR
jgi:hypothetical protein